jgi:hypothetical protein
VYACSDTGDQALRLRFCEITGGMSSLGASTIARHGLWLRTTGPGTAAAIGPLLSGTSFVVLCYSVRDDQSFAWAVGEGMKLVKSRCPHGGALLVGCQADW